MKVKDEIFYHCRRQNLLNLNWEIGNVIKFSKDQENYYFSSLKDCILDLKKSITYINIDTEIGKVAEIVHHEDFDKIRREKQILIVNSQYYIDQINDYFKKTIQLQQELIFDHVRKEINPQLPSRQSCIWVTNSIKDACKWAEIFNCTTILKLKLNGEVHKTNGKFIDINQNKDLYTVKSNAEKYWKGKDNKGDEIEFLFEGNIEILDLLK
jgi:hypothetical protein